MGGGCSSFALHHPHPVGMDEQSDCTSLYSSSCPSSSEDETPPVARITFGDAQMYSYKRSNPKKIRKRSGDSDSPDNTDEVSISDIVISGREELSSDASSVRLAQDFTRDLVLTPHPARMAAGADSLHSDRSVSRSRTHRSRISIGARSRSHSDRSKRSKNKSEGLVKVIKTVTEEVYEDDPVVSPPKQEPTKKFIDMGNFAPTAESRYVIQFKKSHLVRLSEAAGQTNDDTLINLIVKDTQLIPYEVYDHQKQERRRARRNFQKRTN